MTDTHSTKPNGAGGAPWPVNLAVFLVREAQKWLHRRKVRTRQDILHEVVRRAYEDAQGYESPELILELVQALQPLVKQDLLPETRLLLEVLPSVAREVRGNQAFGAMARLQGLLGHLNVGEPLSHRSITIFPLTWSEPQKPPYVLLQTAIEQRTAVIEEVSQNGDAPHLAVTSTCDRPILIVEGEILVGAKQNRVVNITVLVAPRSRFTLPVNCVERGRWQHRSQHFTSEFAAPPSLRSKKMRAVQRNRAEQLGTHSDQGEVWEEVDACLCSMGVESETASLTDSYAAAETKLQEYRIRLEVPEGTAGILVARGGQILGMDLFDSPGTFSALSRRLVDAYALDALRDRRQMRKAVEPEQARKFLDRIAVGARPRVPALGQGEELEIQAQGIVGSALLFKDWVCHLAAFCVTI